MVGTGGASTAPESLRVSLADADTIDQAARAALTPGDPAPGAAVARALGAQLAEAIGCLHPGPLPADRPIVVSTDAGLPTAGDMMITQEAGRILGRQIQFTWQNRQGEQMTISLCPPVTPCF